MFSGPVLILKYLRCLFLVGTPVACVVLDPTLLPASMPRSASYSGMVCNDGLWNMRVSWEISRSFWPIRFSFIS